MWWKLPEILTTAKLVTMKTISGCVEGNLNRHLRHFSAHYSVEQGLFESAAGALTGGIPGPRPKTAGGRHRRHFLLRNGWRSKR